LLRPWIWRLAVVVEGMGSGGVNEDIVLKALAPQNGLEDALGNG
jgi:hypothetical protein